MLNVTKCWFSYSVKEGLAVKGCVKIVLLVTWLIWFLVASNLHSWAHPHSYNAESNVYALFSMKLVIAIVLDIAATVLLLIGIQKENEKYVERVYWYGVVSTISLVHMYGDRFLQVWIWFWYADLEELMWILVQFVFVVAVQAYFTVLVRSHLNNLREQRDNLRERVEQQATLDKATEVEAHYKAQVASAASLLPY